VSNIAVFDRPPVRLGAVIAVAVAAGLVAWLVLRDDGGSSDTQTAASGATAMTPAALASLARSVAHPIFWLGPKPSVTYEVTRTPNGNVYVRYLPKGVSVGSGKPYLTVVTYPFTGSFTAIKKLAGVKGAVTARLARGGVALLDGTYPKSVHVAYPNLNYQIEVYDPRPARAMELVSSGQLRSIGSVAAGGASSASERLSGKPAAVTIAQLRSLARRLGHPIYWAGRKPGYTYELSTTSSGRVFVRYLPPGVGVGDPRAQYTLVATYPFPRAYAVIAKAAANGGATLRLAHGGIGVVDGASPKSIHLAFPGSDYQVEVYDPSPRVARRLVASGAIAPIS
jgi:hypothetical protein